MQDLSSRLTGPRFLTWASEAESYGVCVQGGLLWLRIFRGSNLWSEETCRNR